MKHGAATVAASVVLAIAAPAMAAGPPEPPSQEAAVAVRAVGDAPHESLAGLISDPIDIHPAVLAALPASPELLGGAGELVQSLQLDLEDAIQRQRWAQAESALRTQTLVAATAHRETVQKQLDTAISRRRRAESDLGTFGVEAFVSGSDQTDLEALLGAAGHNQIDAATASIRTTTLFQSAGAELGSELRRREADESTSRRELAAADDLRDRESKLLEEADAIFATASADLLRLQPALNRAERDFEWQLLLRIVPGTDDLTVVAVNAYVTAAERAKDLWPQCRISWNQLAGVGRVESFNGQFGNSSLDRRGNTTSPILGPQLNGDPWLAITDTDGGKLDGDTEWDRAVGPMQFIPTSWELFRADGNGDGHRDPHNMYDATLAAADHLCGSGLDSEAGFRSALLRYNRSTAYGSDVIRFSDLYGSLLIFAPADESAGQNQPVD
ncbi:MAG: hypothetical protein HKN03_09065 [Acidimicrobiales bacterium]|nr:hypothetical protein [Acidimicrobiales bacterium]